MPRRRSGWRARTSGVEASELAAMWGQFPAAVKRRLDEMPPELRCATLVTMVADMHNAEDENSLVRYVQGLVPCDT